MTDILPHVHVSGVSVDALRLDGLLHHVGEFIADGTPKTIAYVNVHVLNVAAGDAELTTFLNAADLCYADGNGVVLAARLLRQHLPGRMTGADWIHDLAARAAANHWRIAWVGGKPGVTARAAAVLSAENAGVNFVLTDHGFHPRGSEHEELMARLAAAKPDIVLVGMGTPIQERWVAANRHRIAAPVVWCVGATADFVSGEVRRGPKLLYSNQEWLARLLSDPRRFWRRFLVGNPVFLARVLRERMTGA